MSDEFDPTAIPSFTSADAAEARRNDPFLGGLVIDRFEPSVDFEGKAIWQYHWAVRPVNVHVTGKTGAFHGFVDYKLGRSSNFLLLTDALGNIFGTEHEGNPRAFGKGNNEGILVGWWVNETFTDLKSRLGGTVNPKFKAVKEYPMPIRIATPDEIAIYTNMAPYTPPVSTAGSSTLDVQDAREYTDDEIDILVNFYDGKLAAQAVRDANRNGHLPPELRGDVINGSAYRKLMEEGRLSQNADKSFAKVS